MNGEFSRDKVFIEKLKDKLAANLGNENFGVSELAKEIGLSRSQLHRKLQDINGKSTSKFIREYRLKQALEMLKNNEATASEIAYRVGFSSPTYFNTSFHNYYGFPPGEVKHRKQEEITKSSLPKKMISIIPVIILIALIIYNENSNNTTFDSTHIDKTIAVLPFTNNSSSEDNMYFCNGITAGIRDKLGKIPEFTVSSRISTEHYRNTKSPIKTIAKKLDVNYLIEGQVQRIGDRAIISAELIHAKDNKVIWSESYNKDVSEIFAVQTDVIASITDKLETIISSDLKTQLNTEPTQDKSAIFHFLRGQEYRFRANKELQKTEDWLELLNKSKEAYKRALQNDSLYADAYLGLAYNIYEENGPFFLEEKKLNEVLNLINKSISINPNLAPAYFLRGRYYQNIKNNKRAQENYDKYIELNPNSSFGLSHKIETYKSDNNYKDAAITLKKLEKVATTRGELSQVYQYYATFYDLMQAYDMVDYYLNKKAEIDPETYYNRYKTWSYMTANRLDEAIEYVKEKCHEDNQDLNAYLGCLYLFKGDFEQALTYSEKGYNQVSKEGINSPASVYIYNIYGSTLIALGQVKKGTEIKKKQIPVLNKILKTVRGNANAPILYLSAIELYASLGQFEKSYEYMKIIEDTNGWHYPGLVSSTICRGTYDSFKEYPKFELFLKSGKNQLAAIKKQMEPHLPLTPPN